MGVSAKITTALAAVVDAGESVLVWRHVASHGRVEPGERAVTPLLGPGLHRAVEAGASVVGRSEVPDGTNLVAVTDRRLVWCHRSLLTGEVDVRGFDPLVAVREVAIEPARIALAKLRLVLVGGTTVTFDLPSDHRATEFAETLRAAASAVGAPC